MLSIDEAIAHAREIAEEQRKDNGKCEYKAEYGCKGCADYYSKPCIECAEEHEQIAEWLEDYKRIKMLIPIEQALKNEYNKAIDDFVKAIVDRGLSANDDKYCITHYDNYLKVIKEIAEQLKAGDK